ncbi:MAG: hypothetical protein ABIN36_17500 [Ferruginibacter sp.]
MKQSLFAKRKFSGYFKYGFLAAIAYIIPVIYFFYDRKYENFYFIYIGTILFMAAILFYALKVLSRPVEKEQAITMLMHEFAVIIMGIAFCILFLIALDFYFSGDIFNTRPMSDTIKDAPGAMEFHKPAGLLLRLIGIMVLTNFGGGSFIAIVITFGGKKNQTEDKAA